MFLKYKPNVKYLKHNDNFVHLEKSGDIIRLKNTFHFDFSKLMDFHPTKDISAELVGILKRGDFCYSTDKIPKPRPETAPKSLDRLLQNFTDLQFLDAKLVQKKVSVVNLTDLNISLHLLAEYTEIGHESFSDALLKHNSDLTELDPTFRIVICENNTDDRLTLLNEFFIKNRTQWILICLELDKLVIGPFFNTQELKYCYSCFLNRLKSNDPLHKISNLKSQVVTQKIFDLYYLSYIQLEIVKSFADDFARYRRAVNVFSPLNSQLDWHPFISYPLCFCGTND